MRIRRILLFTLALSSITAVAHAQQTIERTVTIAPDRIGLRRANGLALVTASGGQLETRAGRPELPWVSERVDLPEGMRITGVEVLDVQTAPFADGVRVGSATVPKPGVDVAERTPEDPRWFQSAAAQPEAAAELGMQGSLRGRNVAWLKIAAARWWPQTGRLERVASVHLRLTLAPFASGAVVRERIVREWEDGPIGASPTRAGRTIVTSMNATEAGLKPAAQPFAATQVPSVLGSPVAYLIITNDALAPTFQQFADWKTQKGFPAVVRTTSFIHAQYPGAADDAERIRLFIRDAYARWGTKWVLLGGDTDVIPERLARTEFFGGENIAADLYYSCLDGNWNADGDALFGEGFADDTDPGDSADLMPEVYVGRAPVSTPAAAQTFINKTLQYEKNPVGGYEHRWLWFAEVLFPQDWVPGDPTSDIQLDGASVAESLLPLTDQRPGIHVGRMYQNFADTLWRPGAVSETRAAVLDSLNQGVNLALHVGHGYRNVMSVGDEDIVNADAAALTNGPKFFNLYAINCTSNAIDFPCIGEAFLDNPNGGAVTNVGSTRFDFPSAGGAYQQEYFRLFVEDSVDAVGELQARQKLPFLPFSYYDGTNRWTQMTLLLLGDPELRMYAGAWRSLAVTHPSSISVADTQFTVHVTTGGQPLANARVTAYMPGDEYRSLTTNGSGDVVMPFRPDSSGSFTLTVTAYNAKPYQATVNVVATGLAAVSEAALTVDDDNVGGTSGNGDGFADAGELVDVRLGLRNRGGAATNGAVTATLTTSDAFVSIVNATATYASIAAGATGNPVTAFRVNVPASTPDQHEVAFNLRIADGSKAWTESFQLTTRAPDLQHYATTETESPGNNNGRPTTGETANYTVKIRNGGTGVARSVTAKLRSLNGAVTVSDSTASIGDIGPGVTTQGDPFVFSVVGTGGLLQLVVSDVTGPRLTKTIDLVFPAPPGFVTPRGQATSIELSWDASADSDLFGYNVYRASLQGGPYTRVNPVPTGRTSFYEDENLTPLTHYYYEVTCVDSSGNESSPSIPVSTNTNPPSHAIFPVPLGRTTPAPVTLEYVYSSQQMDIIAGADHVYVFHADGTAPVDADGTSLTLGDFSLLGTYFPAGVSVGTLDPAQGWSFVAPYWETGTNPNSGDVYVFDKQGNVRPGWPLHLVGTSGIWSPPSIGDLDGDGKAEICFGSNDTQFYVMRADGSEWMDGDANPATKGVFKVLGSASNFASPALADIDGDGKPEIIMGGFDGKLYAWKANGSNVPGFPFQTNGSITDSPAVAYLDGPGDTTPEIVFSTSSDSVYVLEPNGTRRPGWPVWLRSGGTSKIPSPAIADMNNDGFPEIIIQSTNGGLYALQRNGFPLIPWSNIRYSTLTSSASESSPVVGDINGDGFNDIIVGDENAQLTAISGANATVLPGFPIQLDGEVRGAAAVADIDRDGKSEIVLSGWDKNLYVWDYDFPFSPNGPAPWPQFHHDARRTGFVNSPLFVGVDDGPGATPVTHVELAAPSPNPSRRGANTRFSFALPASSAGGTYALDILDLQGRRVRTVDQGIATEGRFSTTWDLRDDARQLVSSGVYFAVFTSGTHRTMQKLIVLP